MLRLVEAGIFVDYPNIKFIIHHAGAMVPFFAERVKWVMNNHPRYHTYPELHRHFKRFYVDTALYGNSPGLMCAYHYYGSDHMLLGTDFPLGPRWGMVEGTVASVDRMEIPEVEKQKIFRDNAIELLRTAL
jgi:predicted TIM-barrel fold metal-dependent hydrolase